MQWTKCSLEEIYKLSHDMPSRESVRSESDISQPTVLHTGHTMAVKITKCTHIYKHKHQLRFIEDEPSLHATATHMDTSRAFETDCW
jgi:hypothetical protein